MAGRVRGASWRAAILAVAAIGVVALGGTALAGHMTGDVKSYTGCLVPKDGVIIKVKQGNSPAGPCNAGMTEVHLSGGDITKISVSGGLTLPNGGDNGEVTIALDPKYSLPQSCASDEVAKWQSSTTSWVCAADNDTTYTAGTGLDLSTGNAFSIEPGYRIPGKACSIPQFARGFDSNGAIQCAAPASTGVEVWQATRGVTFLPKNEGVDLVTLSLPAGTYLMTAKATVSDWSGGARGDEELTVRCGLRNGAFAALPVEGSEVDIGEESTDNVGPAASAVVHGLVSLASSDTVRFTCFARGGDDESDEARDVTMTAIKVGTVHTP